MKHPCFILNTLRHDYSELKQNVQMSQIVDV